MAKSKKQVRRRDPLPKNFRSLEEFWRFWDTHSTADYEDLMQDVNVNVNIRSSKIYLPVAKEIVGQLRAQARRHGVSTETLMNLWLREKVEQQVHGK